MNKTINIIAAFLLICSALSAQARRTPTRVQEEPVVEVKNNKPIHYLNAWGNLGYSSLLNNMEEVKPLGSYGLGLGIGYELQVKKFHFNTGLEFDWLNSTSQINDFTVSRSMEEPYPTMSYHYLFSDMKEVQNAGYLNIPILLGYEFGRYYAMAGVKAGLGFIGNYKSKSNLTIYATDSELIEDLNEMPNHHLSTQKGLSGDGKLSFNMNMALSAEIGINLDEWLAVKPRPVRRGQRPRPKTFKESLHYRASIFADYGLLNVNNFNKNKINYGENSPQNGVIPEFIADDPNVRKINTVLGSKNAEYASVNPLFVGVKFTILYELPKKQVPPPRPVRTPRPKPQTQVTVPVLYGVIYDSETEERIAADIEIFTKDGASSLYKDRSAEQTGYFKTELNAGTYLAHVTKHGYLPFSENITFAKDTVFIPLQMAKQGVKVVLNNMFFATNRTSILPESEQALDDLYVFLSENPEVRIQITGHTDNVGSTSANQKLSEGRAKSVMNDIVNRGIDPSRITYEGKGASEPCATNDTAEGRAQNRRVEITIL